MSATLGIVVGLEAEARIARRWTRHVAIGGGGAAGATRAADTLAPHVTALLSFGLAGALDSALRAGDLVIPATILDGPESWTADPALTARLGGPTHATMLGGGTILATAWDKAAAQARTGATAIDLESAAVARAAARHGLPFAVLRAIADPAHRSLPRAALVALDPQGRVGLLRVLTAALAEPRTWPALIALGRDAAHARATLLRRTKDPLA